MADAVGILLSSGSDTGVWQCGCCGAVVSVRGVDDLANTERERACGRRGAESGFATITTIRAFGIAAATGASLSSVVVSLADGASAMTLLNKLKLTGHLDE